jgi:hypothetical protein
MNGLPALPLFAGKPLGMATREMAKPVGPVCSGGPDRQRQRLRRNQPYRFADRLPGRSLAGFPSRLARQMRCNG